jgi:hypothetical protein
MAESKRSRIERMKKSRSDLQKELTVILTEREIHNSPGTGMSMFYRNRTTEFANRLRNMNSQVRNIEKKISAYTRKIDSLERETRGPG